MQGESCQSDEVQRCPEAKGSGDGIRQTRILGEASAYKEQAEEGGKEEEEQLRRVEDAMSLWDGAGK